MKQNRLRTVAAHYVPRFHLLEIGFFAVMIGAMTLVG